MNKIRRFVKTAGIYFLGSALSNLVLFFLLPLYTNTFKPKQFGTYDIATTLIGFLAPVAFFQIWDGMFRLSFDEGQKHNKYSIISNSYIVIAIGLVVYTILFTTAQLIFQFDYGWLVFLYGISVALNYLYEYIARTFLKNNLFVISGLVNSFLAAVLNITLILYFHVGIESLYISNIIGPLIQVLIIELRIHPLLHFNIKHIEKQKIVNMLRFSIPLCIATVSYWLLSGYTKIVISKELGMYENGLYAVTSKISSMLVMVINIFQFAWNEMAYLMVNDNERYAKYQIGIKYIFRVIFLGSSILMLMCKILFPLFIGDGYQGAINIIPISILAVASNSFAGFLSTIFMTEKKTNWVLWTTIIAAIVNIAAAPILSKMWGLQGCLGALFLSFLILACLRLYALRKTIKIGLNYRDILSVVFSGITIVLFYLLKDNSLIILSCILLICILIFSFRNILVLIINNIGKGELGKR